MGFLFFFWVIIRVRLLVTLFNQLFFLIKKRGVTRVNGFGSSFLTSLIPVIPFQAFAIKPATLSRFYLKTSLKQLQTIMPCVWTLKENQANELAAFLPLAHGYCTADEVSCRLM